MKFSKGVLSNVSIGILLAMFFSAFPVSAITGTLNTKHLIYGLSSLWILLSNFLFNHNDTPKKINGSLRSIFLLYILILVFYSTSVLFLHDSNVLDYTIKLLSFILISLLFLSCCSLKSFTLQIYEFSFYVIIVIYCIFLHIDFARLYAGSGNYLTATLPIGAAFIMAFVRSFDEKLPIFFRLSLLATAIFYLQSMTLFMGRGSFVICIGLSILYFMIMSLNIKRAIYAFSIVLIFFYVGLYYQESFMESSLYSRLTFLADGDVGERSYTYSTFYDALSFESFITGFGFGISGLEIYDLERYYPHNIHFHYLADLGVIGLIFSFIYPLIIILGLYEVYKGSGVQLKVFLFLNLYVYLNFLKSFSMFDSWWLSMSSGFLMCIILKEKNKCYL